MWADSRPQTAGGDRTDLRVVAERSMATTRTARPANAANASTNRFAATTLQAQAAALAKRRGAVIRRAELLRSEVTKAMSQCDRSDLSDSHTPVLDFDATTDLILLEWAERRLWEIDQALTRIADGTYGCCRDCGAGIPLQRLRALPTVPMCVECSQMLHRAWGTSCHNVGQTPVGATPAQDRGGGR